MIQENIYKMVKQKYDTVGIQIGFKPYREERGDKYWKTKRLHTVHVARLHTVHVAHNMYLHMFSYLNFCCICCFFTLSCIMWPYPSGRQCTEGKGCTKQNTSVRGCSTFWVWGRVYFTRRIPVTLSVKWKMEFWSSSVSTITWT